MLKINRLILIFGPLTIFAIMILVTPGPAVAAPHLGITLTPTDAIPTTPVTPTEVTPTATPTATDVVQPPNPTPTPTPRFTATPEEESPRARVTPSLPETGETPAEPPYSRLDWLGFIFAGVIALAGTLAYRRITGSRRES